MNQIFGTYVTENVGSEKGTLVPKNYHNRFVYVRVIARQSIGVFGGNCATVCQSIQNNYTWHLTQHNTTTVLWPFVQDYSGEPVPEETFTHLPFWSSSNLYELLSFTMIHSILPVQIACLAIFLHNLSTRTFWSASWSGALHLIFHTFFHPISVLFLQHMPIPSQPALL